MLQPCLWKAQAATQDIFDMQLPPQNASSQQYNSLHGISQESWRALTLQFPTWTCCPEASDFCNVYARETLTDWDKV